MHTITMGTSDYLGLYRLELQITGGNGKLTMSGSGANTKSKEAIKIAFDYFKANISRVSSMGKVGDHDYHIHIVEIHNTGAAAALTLCSFIAFCSGLMGKPLRSQMVVLGDMSLGGTIVTYSEVISVDKASLLLDRQGVLSRDELISIANKDNLIHAFTFDNYSSFHKKVSFSLLKSNELISGANLVTAECLSTKKLFKLCELGFSNGEKLHA